MKRLALLLCVLATGALLAADWPDGPAKKHAYLEVVIVNKTNRRVDDTGVYFDRHACTSTSGNVGAGGMMAFLDWKQPITTNAVVRWRDRDGKNQEQAVTVVGIYDPKVEGALRFIIGATNVTVEFKKIDSR